MEGSIPGDVAVTQRTPGSGLSEPMSRNAIDLASEDGALANQRVRRGGKAASKATAQTRGNGNRAKADVYAAPVGGTLTQTEHPGPVDNQLGEEGITWGYVDTYSVDADRLMIKLNAGAISRPLISMSSDEPHFRSAVSMAMMAHHTPGKKLTVRYWKPTRRFDPNALEVLFAREVAIGNDPGEALAFEDWPIDYPG